MHDILEGRNKELRFLHQTLPRQIRMIGILGILWLGLYAVEYFLPGFFVYPHLKWGGWESVGHFWPLFAYAAAITLLSVFDSIPINSATNNEIVRYGIAVSLLAGFWEEVGHRYIYIAYSMIMIVVMNWIFGVGLGWVFVAFFALATAALLSQGDVFKGATFALATAGSIYFALHADPVYWFYSILVTITHYTSFTLMDPILYGGAPSLFIMGLIATNVAFRDGHQYQGLFGMINSWYIGLVMIYAMMTYGLWTAVAIHALYDIEIFVIQYLTRKTY